MSKKSTFKSQLFVFADKFDDRFEALFEGKIIFELNFPYRAEASAYDDIYTFHHILDINGQNHKSARIVVNFDRNLKKDIRAYQTVALSYANLVGFLFDGKKDRATLRNFNNMFDYLAALEVDLESLKCFDIEQLVKSIPPLSKADIDDKKNLVIDSMDEYINLSREESYRKFLSSFSV